MAPTLQHFLIALGGNLPSEVGSPADTLQAALQRLEAKGITIGKVSRFYATPCFPEGAGPDYVNAAAAVAFEGRPEALLQVLHEVEAEFGRERVQRWGQRTLDLDLLAAGETVLPDGATHAMWQDLPLAQQLRDAPGQLILPHPRLQERAFVLVPLCDIAPDWRHPVLGVTVSEMLSRLPAADIAAIVPL